MARLLISVGLLLFAASVYGESGSAVSPTTVSSNSGAVSPTPTGSKGTPAPTTVPAPVLNYTILNATRFTCVMMSGAIQMVVGYNLTKPPAQVVPVSVLNTTAHYGSCNSTAANITLRGFYPDANSSLYNITFFMKDDDSQWNVTDVQISINLTNSDIFKNNSEAVPNNQSILSAAKPNPAIFAPGLDDTHSYSCDHNSSYTMTLSKPSSTYNLTLYLANFRLQFFQSTQTNATDFGKEQKCPADIKGSKIVPIAVGIALAGLVLIVIVAYIVGRLRSRKQNSYEALS